MSGRLCVCENVLVAGDMLLALISSLMTPVSSSLTHYFTCRHGFEAPLIAELERLPSDGARATSPCPGAVRLDGDDLPGLPDPTYALQILPDVREVRAPSTKKLAIAAAECVIDHFASDLDGAPRGSLDMHVLVPDLLRGVPPNKAKLLRRGQDVADQMRALLRKRFAAARPVQGSASTDRPDQVLLLQCLLLSPETLSVSICRADQTACGLGFWPARTPAGFVDTSLDGFMPSSAYRKLLEAFACLGLQPARGSRCVDLGACPGGWTAALRRLGCVVTAVDRQPLDDSLMKDFDVEFVQGDAFAFAPDAPVEWAVSDVIAFPERCVHLMGRWTEGRWAQHLVFTMKFKGDEPDFDAIEAARKVAQQHGFACRSKHFFSNKNEITLMASRGSRDPALG